MAPYLGKKKKQTLVSVTPKKKLKRKPRYYRFRRQPVVLIPKVPRLPRVFVVRPPKQRKNRQRTRNKNPYLWSYTETRLDGAIAYHAEYQQFSETMTDWTVKPCNMSVVKRPVIQMEGNFFAGKIVPEKGLAGLLLWNLSGHFFWVEPEATMYCWTSFVNNFKHKKLPTSNQADLLTNLAELDDTIAMLARPKVPSYGSVKWGWMPLISDIMAANDAANAVKSSYLDGNRRTSRYNATHTIVKNSVDVMRNEHTYFHHWEVKVKHVGTVTYENDILAFYDYMGFHPSPKVLWDIVPLSFAIDYILPIGDMLKALSPTKGWVKSVNFTGWQVITATVTEVCKAYPRWSKGPAEGCTRTYVTRTYLSGSALEQKTIPRSISPLKYPSMEQIFDLSYLAEAFNNRTKKILSPHVYRKRK